MHGMRYQSPIGEILIISKNDKLIGVYLETQEVFSVFDAKIIEEEDFVLKKTCSWLDAYFKKEQTDLKIEMELQGTEFQKRVWNLLLKIPYGETVSYQSLAESIQKLYSIPRMSAQAIGNAVSKNPISILIPCHRVVGKNGNLTGYAGGIHKKIALLQLEGCNMSKFTWEDK